MCLESDVDAASRLKEVGGDCVEARQALVGTGIPPIKIAMNC